MTKVTLLGLSFLSPVFVIFYLTLRFNVTVLVPIMTTIEALPFFNALNRPAASIDTTFLFVLWKVITPWALAGVAATLSFSSSPTFIVLLGGGFFMLIDVAAFPPTVISIFTNLPLSAVAVTITEPAFNAFTLPVWVTETVLGSLDTQVSFAFELSLVTGATPNVADEPFLRYTLDCDTATFVTFTIGV